MYLHLLHNPEHKLAFLRLAQMIAGADGFVARNERSYLRSFADELGVTDTSSWSADEGADLETLLGGIKDEQVKNVFVAELMLLVFADGSFSEHEVKILDNVKRIFGYSDETFERFKDWAIRMDRLRTEGVKLILDPDWDGQT